MFGLQEGRHLPATLLNSRALRLLYAPAFLLVLEAVLFQTTLKPYIGGNLAFAGLLLWVAVFVFTGRIRYPAAFRDFLDGQVRVSVNRILLCVHLLVLFPLAFFTWTLTPGHYGRGARPAVFVITMWYLAVIVAAAPAALAFVRLKSIRDLLRRTGLLWLYAAAAVTTALWAATATTPGVWQFATRMTFTLVELLLRPLVSHVVTNPTAARIGTDRFTVVISYTCSGIEGVTMMLILCAGWLWFSRKQLLFPRSFILVPACVILTFLLNSVRIATLILIGHAGARQLARGGFHSDAGWIFFLTIALGMIYVAQSTWFQREVVAHSTAPSSSVISSEAGTFAEDNATAAYLAPLVVILATAMVTRAASSRFDLLYPLRFVAAAAVLWIYRRKYFHLNWRFGGMSVLLGTAVFLLWIIPLHWTVAPGTTLGTDLNSLPRWNRDLWLTFRILGAILTVPIAEELAFRGFVLRRLQTAEFESVNWKSFTWPALLVSSLIFGIMHGDRWVVGTLAGLIYAAAMLWRGRLGDATIAHATSNALLGVWVITHGAWYLW